MSDKVFLKNGTEHIRNLIKTAVENGENTVTLTGNYEIESEIRIPSNFTLVLDGCHLIMADGVYSNMFVNMNHNTPIGRTVDGKDKNITIIGKNNPILDGGNYNGLSEKNSRKDGLPPIWKNQLIMFANVDNFEITDITCHNQRHWAIDCVYCTNGHIHDIDFKANDIWVDEEGNEHHYLERKKYNQTLVKNADGVDIRQGCHDILIENITGFCEDDSVAITSIRGNIEQTFEVEGMPSEICNITVKNIRTSAFCSNVRLLALGGAKLHDVLVDGVYDTSKDSPYMDKGLYGVRIGDIIKYSANRFARADEVYNITIRNVVSRSSYGVISLLGEMTNVRVENYEALEGTPEIER